MAAVKDKRISLDWTKAHDVVPLEKAISQNLSAIVQAKKTLVSGQGKGADFTGWVKYTNDLAWRTLEDIQKTVETVCSHSDAVVVIGIGGSLLGSKAVYEALTHSYAALNPAEFHRRPLLFWAGGHLATDELAELLDALDAYTPSLVVISKSGGTTEPALSFRILKEYLEERFGVDEAAARIVAITDPDSGTLLKVAQENDYPTFQIPKNIGGRYSIFTAVGLLPLAIAGIDVEGFVSGARQAANDAMSEKNESFETNPALCYAAIRNALYAQGYKVEALCTWTPKLASIAEWWKQLFAESDGKGNSGILTTSARFTTDLHSLGQYFQEGERMMFATHIRVVDEYSQTKGCVKRKLRLPEAHLKDGFEFLVNSELGSVQVEAQQGTFLAHSDGKLPTMVWDLPELNAYWLGYWMYTNMFACGVGGYARGINPFDQPGVEAYKNNMFALLGKPGFTDKANDIRTRLERGSRLRSMGLSTHE